ncbi:putative holin-like toxin [Virgibacillus dakarensis]|uniref:putative holin-like toxin n=1 Tax=Virgibacillus dakarensis TaxID=1917889 RepID=UPI000B451C13
MTTYEALSLVAQFSLTLVATFTLIVTIVVYLIKKSNRPLSQGQRLLHLDKNIIMLANCFSCSV